LFPVNLAKRKIVQKFHLRDKMLLISGSELEFDAE
jgi:hypothetical protein